MFLPDFHIGRCPRLWWKLVTAVWVCVSIFVSVTLIFLSRPRDSFQLCLCQQNRVFSTRPPDTSNHVCDDQKWPFKPKMMFSWPELSVFCALTYLWFCRNIPSWSLFILMTGLSFPDLRQGNISGCCRNNYNDKVCIDVLCQWRFFRIAKDTHCIWLWKYYFSFNGQNSASTVLAITLWLSTGPPGWNSSLLAELLLAKRKDCSLDRRKQHNDNNDNAFMIQLHVLHSLFEIKNQSSKENY